MSPRSGWSTAKKVDGTAGAARSLDRLDPGPSMALVEEERRESRIPRAPPAPRVLAERSNTTHAVAGKRHKAAGGALDAIPESSNKRPTRATTTENAAAEAAKRHTRSTAGPPTTSAAAAPATSAGTGPFGRTDAAPTASGPPGGAAAADESFEQLSARTGVSLQDVLQRKMQFKKGMKPEKKLEEVTPMVKDLRAVGWHLLAAKERAEMEASQWKKHSEQLEEQAATAKTQQAATNEGLEQQVRDVQAQVNTAALNSATQAQQLQQAETLATQQEVDAAAQRALLQGVQEELARERATRAERDAKVSELDQVVRDAHKYQATLQGYNTRLQDDLAACQARHAEAVAGRDDLSGQVARLSGELQSSARQQQLDRDQVGALRDERDGAVRDAALLRADADNVRLERTRALADATASKDELDRFKAMGGKSYEMLESANNDKATLEVQLSTQHKLLHSMREELAAAKERSAAAEGLADSRGTNVADLKAENVQLQEGLVVSERKVYEGDLIRRKLHNLIQELKGNIRVFCRVRPVSAAERSAADHNSDDAVDFPENADANVLGSGTIGLQEAPRGTAAPARHAFSFDRVFTPTTSQDEVFVEISELVQSALDGQKVCIFAYGQTGSGKTYTMMGSRDSPGMIPRAMEQVFASSKLLGAQGWTFTMQASMLEIYNEEIKDLLVRRKGSSTAAPKEHKVQHDLTTGTTVVTELATFDVTQPERVEALLADAMEKRSVGCTQLNEQSSRSHMVFTLKIEGYNAAKDARVFGVLNLIDLAGSERVKDSGAQGQRMKEAQSINKSLSALGDVIAALANKDSHIPFRNSKLTYLLQTCLGGDAKTLMFVNVAPQREFAGESLCSLRFAAKVNSCEINPRRGGAGPAAK